MAKINELFLKAIFQEKEVDIEEKSITLAVNKMAKFVTPDLLMDENNDYSLYYSVDFNTLKDLDIDETQAFELRQCGWEMDDSTNCIIKKL